MKTATYGLIGAFLLQTCASNMLPVQFSLAPSSVRSAAYEQASTWVDVPYLYGGQSRLGVDCSGLVVEVYRAAVAQHGFGVPFRDANVRDLLTHYTVEIPVPEKGDLVFMGHGSITHVALFEREEAGIVYFIDAFEGNTAVAYRSYFATSTAIRMYARMLVYRE